MTRRSGKSERFGKFGDVRKADPSLFQARFGELVRNARVRRGLTQTDVARLVFNDEEAKSRVSDVERGRNEPQADTINRFCEALGIAYEDVEALRPTNSIIHPQLSPEHIVHPDIRPVPGFTGRKDLLAGIEQALWRKGGTAALTNDTASAAVKGLGGVGKSVLAREYAWRERGRYRGVWWVRAETEQTLIEDLIDLGSRLIPNLKEVPERDRALHLALDAIAAAGADKPWLIVYDNVEKPGAIAKLTPRERAHILITSRWPRWQGHAQELPVDVFPAETAVDLLLAERPHETREAAARLAATLGHLPLALSHARAYCAETNLSFDDYARRLSELIQEAPEDAEYPASVFATFSLAIAKAAQACPEAEKLMEIAAFLAPECIPLSIITDDVMNQKQREKAVAALFRVSLVGHETLGGGSLGFSVHRLVQEVTHNRVGEKITDILPLAMSLVNKVLSNDSFNGTATKESRWLLPHTRALLHRAPTHGKEASNTALLNYHAGCLLLAERKYEEAEPFVEQALAIAEEVHGSEHPSTVLCLERMSEVYHRQHRNAEAESLLRRSLAIREQISGQNERGFIISLQNLAHVCSYLGRQEEAVSLYEQSIAMAETLFGPDDHTTKNLSSGYEIYKFKMSKEFGNW